MINVDEKLTKNVKIKKIVEKKFLKKKENFNTMIFDIVNVKNSNAKIFIKYYIDDTTTISNSFTKFFFEFENFFKERRRNASAREKTKKNKTKTKTKVSKRRKKKR